MYLWIALISILCHSFLSDLSVCLLVEWMAFKKNKNICLIEAIYSTCIVVFHLNALTWFSWCTIVQCTLTKVFWLNWDFELLLYIYLSIYPSIYLSIYPSIYLSIYPSIYLSIYLLEGVDVVDESVVAGLAACGQVVHNSKKLNPANHHRWHKKNTNLSGHVN